MDPVLKEKLKISKRSKNQKLLLIRFIKLLFFVFTLGLFLSSPLWLPSTLSILEKLAGIAFGPKGLFVVCNIIVVVLLSESKLSKSTLQTDLYEEVVNRRRSIQKLSGNRNNAEAENDKEGEEGSEEVDKKGLDELNKRVEDFIARVNKQRKLEAKLINCFN